MFRRVQEQIIDSTYIHTPEIEQDTVVIPIDSTEHNVEVLPTDTLQESTDTQEDTVKVTLHTDTVRFTSAETTSDSTRHTPAKSTIIETPLLTEDTIISQIDSTAILPVQPIDTIKTCKIKQGIAGTPINYIAKRDDLVTGILLVCFILLMWVFGKGRRFLLSEFANFFTSFRRGQGLKAIETNLDKVGRTSLFFTASILQGLLLFTYQIGRAHV